MSTVVKTIPIDGSANSETEPSSHPDGFVHFAVTPQPREVVGVCPLFDFAQQVDRFSLVARFAWIVDGYNHLDIHRDYVPIALDQASASYSLPWNPHHQSSSKK